MDKYDWNSSINRNLFILEKMGLWPKSHDGYKLDFYMVRTVAMCTLFVFLHILVQLINLYLIRNDLEAVAGISFIVLIKLLAAFKCSFLVGEMKMLKHLVKIWNSATFQPRNSQQLTSIAKNLRPWQIIKNIYLAACAGGIGFWAVFPYFERRLPFTAWFPFDTKKSPFYEITYLYQMASAFYICTVQVSTDLLIAAFSMCIGCQFAILKDNLKGLGNTKENNSSKIEEELVKCIEHHKEILSFAKKTNTFLKWIIFIQFFVSGIAIGITMFQLTLIAPSSSYFFILIAYNLSIILEIFIYCWLGEQVQNQSETVHYTAFECEWLELSTEVKKDLVFFTLHLQQPVQLSALNLFYLSLATFVRIMRTAYSYFALLHQASA